MQKKGILDLKNRRKIFRCISENPGLHLRSLFKKFDMSEGTIKYHLHYLLQRELIVEKTEDGYSRFFIKDKVSTKEKNVLIALRSETTRYVLLEFLLHLCRSRKDICDELDRDTKTIAHHLDKLKELGLIEPAPIGDGFIYTNSKDSPIMKRVPKGSEIIFRMKDPQFIYDSFIRYEGSLDDKLTQTMLKWFNYIIEGPQPDELQDNSEYLDRAIAIFYDIFPNPYFA